MGIEIERKFLVSSDGWRTAAHRVIPMAQGYINDMGALDSGSQNASVRVRIEGDHAALNLKSRTLGHTRQEFDYPIPVEDARALLALCVGGLIDKRRHLVEHGAPHETRRLQFAQLLGEHLVGHLRDEPGQLTVAARPLQQVEADDQLPLPAQVS